MIKYKNISFSAKTFYGTRFEPGEIKSVPGFINSPSMVRIFSDKAKPVPSKSKLFEEPPKVETRGRKKKTIEPEKEQVAENETKIVEIPEEETSNGNPS